MQGPPGPHPQTTSLWDTLPRGQSHSNSLLPQTCCPALGKGFILLTGVLRGHRGPKESTPAPGLERQAPLWNARHPSGWSLRSCRTVVITPHCFPVPPPAPAGLGPSLLGKGAGGMNSEGGTWNHTEEGLTQPQNGRGRKRRIG